MKINLDPTKWYYNIDGDLYEFTSPEMLDDSHKYGYLQSMINLFKVIVPYLRKRKLVSYPASGQPLYSREQAIEILNRFYHRCPWKEGDERECWAESEYERFTLHSLI